MSPQPLSPTAPWTGEESSGLDTPTRAAFADLDSEPPACAPSAKLSRAGKASLPFGLVIPGGENAKCGESSCDGTGGLRGVLAESIVLGAENINSDSIPAAGSSTAMGASSALFCETDKSLEADAPALEASGQAPLKIFAVSEVAVVGAKAKTGAFPGASFPPLNAKPPLPILPDNAATVVAAPTGASTAPPERFVSHAAHLFSFSSFRARHTPHFHLPCSSFLNMSPQPLSPTAPWTGEESSGLDTPTRAAFADLDSEPPACAPSAKLSRAGKASLPFGLVIPGGENAKCGESSCDGTGGLRGVLAESIVLGAENINSDSIPAAGSSTAMGASSVHTFGLNVALVKVCILDFSNSKATAFGFVAVMFDVVDFDFDLSFNPVCRVCLCTNPISSWS